MRGYELDRYIEGGVLSAQTKQQEKYMFVMYNASLTVEGIYFEERTAEPGVDKSLFRMYKSPYKWLRLRRNIFDIIN